MSNVDSNGDSEELEKASKAALYYLQRKRGYRYTSYIAKGGYGIVATMYDSVRGCQIAVKCTRNPGAMELEKWCSFSHPNVLPLLEAIVLDVCVVFIMPVYRQDLWGVCENDGFYRDPMSFGLCRLWIKDLLKGLAYLHERSLCHLDLKLDNAFLKDNGHACLGDFSLMSDVNTLTMESPFLEQFQPPEFTPNYKKFSGIKTAEPVPLKGDKADMWQFGLLIIDLLIDRKISSDLNSEYEVWEYDVWPFLQKFVRDLNYMAFCIMGQFPNYDFADEIPICRDLLTKLLCMDPNERTPAKLAIEHPFANISAWPQLKKPPGDSPVLVEINVAKERSDAVTPDQLRTALQELALKYEEATASEKESGPKADSDAAIPGTSKGTKPTQPKLPVAGPSTKNGSMLMSKLQSALPKLKKKKKKKRIVENLKQR